MADEATQGIRYTAGAPSLAGVSREEFEDLLGSVWLYVPWRFVTAQLTSPQRELFAAAVEASSERLHPGEGASADRWWLGGVDDGSAERPGSSQRSACRVGPPVRSSSRFSRPGVVSDGVGSGDVVDCVAVWLARLDAGVSVEAVADEFGVPVQSVDVARAAAAVVCRTVGSAAGSSVDGSG